MYCFLTVLTVVFRLVGPGLESLSYAVNQSTGEQKSKTNLTRNNSESNMPAKTMLYNSHNALSRLGPFLQFEAVPVKKPVDRDACGLFTVNRGHCF